MSLLSIHSKAYLSPLRIDIPVHLSFQISSEDSHPRLLCSQGLWTQSVSRYRSVGGRGERWTPWFKNLEFWLMVLATQTYFPDVLPHSLIQVCDAEAGMRCQTIIQPIFHSKCAVHAVCLFQITLHSLFAMLNQTLRLRIRKRCCIQFKNLTSGHQCCHDFECSQPVIVRFGLCLNKQIHVEGILPNVVTSKGFGNLKFRGNMISNFGFWYTFWILWGQLIGKRSSSWNSKTSADHHRKNPLGFWQFWPIFSTWLFPSKMCSGAQQKFWKQRNTNRKCLNKSTMFWTFEIQEQPIIWILVFSLDWHPQKGQTWQCFIWPWSYTGLRRDDNLGFASY